uniref:Uncharacterized protein n=1 Tax=Arundo donax TaxID=35708 RepID=A0A0A9AAJ9_ARUDO
MRGQASWTRAWAAACWCCPPGAALLFPAAGARWFLLATAC